MDALNLLAIADVRCSLRETLPHAETAGNSGESVIARRGLPRGHIEVTLSRQHEFEPGPPTVDHIKLVDLAVNVWSSRGPR